jgi:S-formylglutathione hydrolase FrmB
MVQAPLLEEDGEWGHCGTLARDVPRPAAPMMRVTGGHVDTALYADISLLHGWLPWLVIATTPIALIVGIGWRRGRWKEQLLYGVTIAIGTMLIAALVIHVLDLVPWDFPVTFYVWAGLVVFAIAAAVIGWPGAPAWEQVLSVVAVVLTGALLGLLVNREYGYYPTVAALFGDDPDEVSFSRLDQIRAEVKRTGQLPANGVTLQLAIPSPVSGFPARDGFVYLPPYWFGDPQPAVPVLMLIGGEPGDASNWTAGAMADDTADAFAAQHGGKAPILVMPDANGSFTADTECVDSTELGNAETYLVQDVPIFMRRTFAAASSPMAVGGLSEGGMCSLMLALRHPREFTTFADFSGLAGPELDPPQSALQDLFGGNQAAFDAHDPTKILQQQKFPGMAGWFEVGQQDAQPLAATEGLVPEARAAGITTCVLIRPGQHDFQFWTQALVNALPWLSGRLGITPMPATTPANC